MKQILKGILYLVAFLAAGPVLAQAGPRIDVVFLLDATGSMGDEIDEVKAKIQEMISQIALGDPAPDVRFGIVAYRDRGDEYITAVYKLTRDIDEIADNLAQITADGGGDYPESLNEALHVAIHEVNWETGPAVTKLIFLIADAPPHLDYPDDYDYREEYQMAAAQGIVVHAIGASGLDEEGERIFRELAAGTGGEFQWLAYETRYTDQDGEEVVVVVEGRRATYTKGDSTWTEEGGGTLVLMAGGSRGMEEKGGAIPETIEAPSTAEVAGPASTSTNLASLITSAVKAAAEEKGVEYGAETAIEKTSWGEVKQIAR